MAKVLDNRVAVITGSGAGMGRATALAMAREGAKIVVNDVVAERADRVANEIIAGGAEAVPFVGDISKFETAGKLISTAVDVFGKIDILHNNAGILEERAIWEFNEEEWDLILSVNLKGAFNCIRHASRHMMQQKWGRIINVSSAARIGTFWSAAYSASKAGIVGLTGAVARDLAQYGITCNVYLPFAASLMNTNEKRKAFFGQKYQQGEITKEVFDRLMNPPPAEKIPPLIIFLSTGEAAGINGQVFGIEGDFISIYSESYKKKTVFKTQGWTVDELKIAVQNILLQGD